MKQSSIDVLARTGISMEELNKVSASLQIKLERDNRVCVCGHGMNRHSTAAGIVSCKPSRMKCLCKQVRPILTCNNTRPFMRKTEGSGSSHALMQGIRKAIELGAEVEWIEEPVCDFCKEVATVSPHTVTQLGSIALRETGYNVMICPACVEVNS